MPEIMDYQETMSQVWRKYDKDPEGWTFLQIESPRKDRFRLFFSDGEDTWYLEAFKTANNLKGKGTKFENRTIQDFVEERNFEVSSGVRPLSEEKLKQFMQKGQVPQEHLEKIFKSKPKSTKRMKSKIGLIGPQYMVPDESIQLSSSQKDLQEKLSRMVDDFEKSHLRYIG